MDRACLLHDVTLAASVWLSCCGWSCTIYTVDAIGSRSVFYESVWQEYR